MAMHIASGRQALAPAATHARVTQARTSRAIHAPEASGLWPTPVPPQVPRLLTLLLADHRCPHCTRSLRWCRVRVQTVLRHSKVQGEWREEVHICPACQGWMRTVAPVALAPWRHPLYTAASLFPQGGPGR